MLICTNKGVRNCNEWIMLVLLKKNLGKHASRKVSCSFINYIKLLEC